MRNNTDAESRNYDINTSGNYEVIDDARVVVGDNPPREKGTKVHVNSTKNTSASNAEHMIRVIEGGQAFILLEKFDPMNIAR